MSQHAPVQRRDTAASAVASATTSSEGGPGTWAVAMAELARELHSCFPDVDATVSAVAAAAVSVLPGVSAAGVVRAGRDGGLTCQAGSDAKVLQLVQVEQRAGDGPCRHLLQGHGAAKVVLNDMGGECRWPAYAAAAIAIGVAAVTAVRLDSGGIGRGNTGNLVLLLAGGGFDEVAEDGVDVFTAHAGLAVVQARVHTDLLAALDTRGVIGRATGILMHMHKITGQQAFAQLVKSSQNTNIPLRQIADQVATTGELLCP